MRQVRRTLWHSAVALAVVLAVTGAAAQDTRVGEAVAAGHATSSAYAEARRSLIAGDYARAASLARGLAEEAPSEATYRLLALAESRSDRLAEAVWALRSAAALGAPTERAMIVEEVYAPLPPELRPLPRRGISAVASAVTRSPVPQLPAGLALASALALAVITATWLIDPGRIPVGVRWGGGALAALLLLVGLLLAFRQNRLAHPAEAVVLAKAPLLEAPGEAAPTVRELPAGAVVTAGEQLGDYVAVSLPSGKTGWVEAGVLRPVAPLASE